MPMYLYTSLVLGTHRKILVEINNQFLHITPKSSLRTGLTSLIWRGRRHEHISNYRSGIWDS